MQSEMQSSFQRVEQALQRLTDSIAAYNPDVRAAEELATADAAVGDDLKKLVRHQRNYLRKEELQRQTDALDAKIKTRIRNISDMRKELLAIPAYETTDGAPKEIAVEELLRYAKYISKTSVPPTLPKWEEGNKPAAAAAVKQEDSSSKQLANGGATPADTQMADANVDGPPAAAENTAMDETRHIRSWQRAELEKFTHFAPWPEEVPMQSGALGAIQRMVEAGEDPAGVLSKEEQAEVARRRAEEEERERAEMAERERRWAGAGVGGGRRRETVEEVFNPDEI